MGSVLKYLRHCPDMCGLEGGARICYPCLVMDKLTEDAVRKIEQIHSSWIEFEVAGEGHRLMTLCADDIELLPPDAQPVLGRAAVSARLTHGNTRIHSIEITNRLIRGSNEIAYVTAKYKTAFSLPEDSTPRQSLGSHLGYCKNRPIRGLSLS